MVAEVTHPSHGVGIELGWAMQRANYPVLCLYEDGGPFRVSGLISGCDKFVKQSYSGTSFVEAIESFFRNHSDQ